MVNPRERRANNDVRSIGGGKTAADTLLLLALTSIRGGEAASIAADAPLGRFPVSSVICPIFTVLINVRFARGVPAAILFSPPRVSTRMPIIRGAVCGDVSAADISYVIVCASFVPIHHSKQPFYILLATQVIGARAGGIHWNRSIGAETCKASHICFSWEDCFLEIGIPFMETRHTRRTPCASSRGGGGAAFTTRETQADILSCDTVTGARARRSRARLFGARGPRQIAMRAG